MHRRLAFLAAAGLVAVSLTATALATGLLTVPGGTDPSPAALATPASAPPPTAAPTLEPTPAATLQPPTPYVASSIDRAGIVARLRAALDAGQASLAAPGIVASVLFPDGRQWTGTAGVADLATGRELTPDTPFAVASISKTFLAAEILHPRGRGPARPRRGRGAPRPGGAGRR